MNMWNTKPWRHRSTVNRRQAKAMALSAMAIRPSDAGSCDPPWLGRSRSKRRRNAGFSLLEMIIATAILAASGMVLSSLLGLGARFGNRAEERTLAIEQAHSVLAQFLAQAPSAESLDEVSGELPGVPANSFRIRVEAYTPSGDSATALGQLLRRVTVEVFAGPGDAASETNQPLCRLSQLVRAHQHSAGQDAAASPEYSQSMGNTR